MIGGGPPWAGQSLLSSRRWVAAADGLAAVSGLGTWFRADSGHSVTVDGQTVTTQAARVGGQTATGACIYRAARTNGRATARPALQFVGPQGHGQITNYAPVLGDCTLLAVLDAFSSLAYDRILDARPETGPWISRGPNSGTMGGGFGDGDIAPIYGTYAALNTAPLMALLLVRSGNSVQFFDLLTSVSTPLWTSAPANALSDGAPIRVGMNQSGGQRGTFCYYDWAVWPRGVIAPERQTIADYVTGRYLP